MPNTIDANSTQPSDINDAKWQQFHDAGTGHNYWYDPDTDHSTWTQPTALQQSTSEIDDGMALQPLAQCTNSDDDESSSDDTTSSDDDDSVEPAPTLAKYSSDRYEPQKNDDSIDNAIDVSHTNGVIQNTLWNIAASQGDNYVFEIYAQHYFRQNKKGSAGDLIRFQAYNKFKHSLHKMDSKLDKQSKQIWKNVNSYMLLRKSSKSDSGHIDKLMRCALKAPQIVRDELFCQICKQTHGNPKRDSLFKGWQLMCIVCAIFPPSEQLAPFLATYLLNNTKTMGECAECALFALKALDVAMVTGPRVSQPMDIEIQSIEQRRPISVQVYFLDGSIQHLLVTSQTQTRDVVHEITKKLRLNACDTYGLFYIRQGCRQEEQQMPCDGELEQDERIMDVYSSKRKDITLIFKCKWHSTIQRNSYSYNDWKYAFMSVHWNVIHGIYPLRVEDLYHLAAIQIQATHGIKEDQFYRPGLLINAIHEYVPYAMIIKEDSSTHIQRVEAHILNRHKIYKHLNQKKAFKQYFEYLSTSNSSHCYDCSFFRCTPSAQPIAKVKKAAANESSDLLVGISEREVLFIHPTSLAIGKRYTMDEIQTFGFRKNAFLFVVGASLVQQQRLCLTTSRGKEMNDMMKFYWG